METVSVQKVGSDGAFLCEATFWSNSVFSQRILLLYSEIIKSLKTMTQIQEHTANGWHIGHLNYQPSFGFGSSSILLGITCAWALWWLWRFVLSPRLFPLEVREYPYWIPGRNIVLFTKFGMINNANSHVFSSSAW